MPARAAVEKVVKPRRTEPPKLFKISDEMKEWCGLLGAELVTWPGVRIKPMFGLVSYYRGGKIFAALPRTRAVNSPESIIFKFHRENPETRRARKQLQEYEALKWLAFEIPSADGLRQALRWLDLAYRMAR